MVSIGSIPNGSPRRTLSSVVVSSGVTGSGYSSNCDSVNPAMKAAIDTLRNSDGIATVLPSGNDGFTNGINYPACISSAISVAATEVFDEVWNSSNTTKHRQPVCAGRRRLLVDPDKRVRVCQWHIAGCSAGRGRHRAYGRGDGALVFRNSHPNDLAQDRQTDYGAWLHDTANRHRCGIRCHFHRWV